MQPLRYLDNIEDTALSDLYQQHAPALLTHLLANTHSIEDAEDLLLDVFDAALERASLRALSVEEQRAWLWRVARNKVVDHYRKRSRRIHVPLEEVSETTFADDELAPEQGAMRNEEHRDLRDAIKRLPALQQEILLLRFVNGLYEDTYKLMSEYHLL
jgi:RNA polymerase sigma-70 factor (ECF subfamily)